MLLKAETDIYGHAVQLTSADLRRFLDLIDGYMKVPYTIHEIRQDNVHDLNGRVDIEVCYNNEKNQQVRQKLLILNNELIDGKTFHKRHDEWYGEITEEQEKAHILILTAIAIELYASIGYVAHCRTLNAKVNTHDVTFVMIYRFRYIIDDLGNDTLSLYNNAHGAMLCRC